MASKKQPTSAKESTPSKPRTKIKNTRKPGQRAGTKKPTVDKAAGPPKAAFSARLFALPGLESEDFPGILTIVNNQASLSGTLLLFGDTSDVAAAIHAAADVLERRGFQSGQSVTITGSRAVLHLSDHPLPVILMTNARATQ